MLVPKNVLKDLPRIADADAGGRLALAGVRLERDDDGAAVAIATDGRRLVALTWPESPADLAEFPAGPLSAAAAADFGGVIIPIAGCKDAGRMKTGGKSCRKPVLRYLAIDEAAVAANGNRRVPIVAVDADLNRSQIEPAALEGRFPKWRECIPPRAADKTAAVLVDPLYLAECLQVIAAHVAEDGERAGVVLSFDRENPAESPVTISAETADGRRAVGVVMPVANREHKNGPLVAPAPLWIAGAATITPAAKPAAVPAKPQAEPQAAPAGPPENFAIGAAVRFTYHGRPRAGVVREVAAENFMVELLNEADLGKTKRFRYDKCEGLTVDIPTPPPAAAGRADAPEPIDAPADAPQAPAKAAAPEPTNQPPAAKPRRTRKPRAAKPPKTAEPEPAATPADDQAAVDLAVLLYGATVAGW